MVTRIRNNHSVPLRRHPNAGGMTLQLAIILVPVIFGFMGFAIDLGRMYLIRGELNQAATAMALAAAAKLNSTTAAAGTAIAAANATLDTSLGAGNKYNFGSLAVGQGDALLTSTVYSPGFFANLADALAAVGQSGDSASDGSLARHVTINLTADAPLFFWSMFSFGQSRKAPIAGAAVAGWSAPVCTACGIEPFAIPRQDRGDTDPDNFGFVAGTLYTLGYQCNGAPVPAPLAGTVTPRIPYLILDRFNIASAVAEDQQLYQIGAQGLIPSPNPLLACARILGAENIWATAAPRNCGNATPNTSVQAAMCGLSSRLSADVPASCTNITDVATLSASYPVDTDTTSLIDYTAYQGDNRRIMTLPIVETLAIDGSMTVAGFRQFLFEPNSGATSNTPSDFNGRFVAMYLGTVAPVRQGRFDGGCGITSGPGKVVLNQ